MKINMNEKHTVLVALESGIIDKKPTKTIIPLCKYYLQGGLKPEEVDQKIKEFMNRHYEGYVASDWNEKIWKWIKQLYRTGNFELTNVTEVRITEAELHTIRNLNHKNLESISFVMLFHAKVRNMINIKNNDWVCSDTNEIFKDAKLSNVKKIKKEQMIGLLLKEGLFNESKEISNPNIKVNFIEKDASNYENGLMITDFKHFVYDYLIWRGSKLKKCENQECGALIIINSNRTRFCQKCANENRKRYQKEWIASKKVKFDS